MQRERERATHLLIFMTLEMGGGPNSQTQNTKTCAHNQPISCGEISIKCRCVCVRKHSTRDFYEYEIVLHTRAVFLLLFGAYDEIKKPSKFAKTAPNPCKHDVAQKCLFARKQLFYRVSMRWQWDTPFFWYAKLRKSVPACLLPFCLPSSILVLGAADGIHSSQASERASALRIQPDKFNKDKCALAHRKRIGACAQTRLHSGRHLILVCVCVFDDYSITVVLSRGPRHPVGRICVCCYATVRRNPA